MIISNYIQLPSSKLVLGEGEDSVRDGCKSLGPELQTALLREFENSRNGVGREKRVIISIMQWGKGGGWGTGERKGWSAFRGLAEA